MKGTVFLFLIVILAILTLLIYGGTNERSDLVEFSLGSLALYFLGDWVIPALRGPGSKPEFGQPRDEALPTWQHHHG